MLKILSYLLKPIKIYVILKIVIKINKEKWYV